MSQLNTQQMGRLIAAGSKKNLDSVIGALASLNAIHFVEYDGSEEGFELGAPNDEAELVGRNLMKIRSAVSLVEVDGPSSPVSIQYVRDSLGSDLTANVEVLLKKSSRLDEVENSLASLSEEGNLLSMIAPLNIDIDLLSGFQNLTSFVGTVSDLTVAEIAGDKGLFFSCIAEKQQVVAVFVKNEDAIDVQSTLDAAGFQALSLPSGVGEAAARYVEINQSSEALAEEQSGLKEDFIDWADDNGESLVCGLELLERDHEMLTTPVKVAVSKHAFIVDGWVEMSRADEIQSALSDSCLYTEISPFVIVAGGGGHGHADEHHHQAMPPIAYAERNLSKPMELLTDAVGRPAYGRIDPTIFMFITYPLFFGMMLGDMVYGIVTMGLGYMLIRKAGTNEMLNLGGKFLLYIGLGTFIFGYLYAEFAGFEIFPHHGTNPAQALSVLYPELTGGHFWSASLPYGIELAYPFHRVVSTADHGNLEHLILLTIYIGALHVMFGLIIGFRDILLYGNGHGGIGLVCAFFEKGSWMILLIGGFFFAYGFLGPAEGAAMMMPGAAMAIFATVLLMWTLYKYHGVPFPINIGLAPIEAIGMMPTVISYVRLFAVGVVGVKIAETGNDKLFHPMFEMISTGDTLYLVPLLLIGWLAVQFFAWGLGVFSPNIHAARLHFVEWMRQYYDSSGEAFLPFGFRSRHVEVE